MGFLTTFLHQVAHPELLVQAYGTIGVALLVFAESGLLIGIFLPGDSLLFAAGLLAGGGTLAYLPLVTLVALAAILGDSFGYWFGRRVGGALAARPDSRFFKQEYLHRTEAFYIKYGPRAIVLARFMPIIRTITPILAGTARMPYGQFLTYNIIGGLAWGVGGISISYFLGSTFPALSHYVLPISLAIVAVSFLPILVNIIRGRRAL